MSRPFDIAENAFEAASLTYEKTPSTPVEGMPTSALIAELVSYLTPNEERDKAAFAWGGTASAAEIKDRQDAVVTEIDRRMPK